MSTVNYSFKSFSFCDSFSEDVDRLCKAGGDIKYFDAMYELFTLAACIGFKFSKKVASIKTGKTIEFNQFRSFENFDGIFLSICLADYEELSVLEESEEMISLKMKIFSEYANGGMSIIKEKLIDKPGKFQESLISLLCEYGVGYAQDAQVPSGGLKYVHILKGLS